MANNYVNIFTKYKHIILGWLLRDIKLKLYPWDSEVINRVILKNDDMELGTVFAIF